MPVEDLTQAELCLNVLGFKPMIVESLLKQMNMFVMVWKLQHYLKQSRFSEILDACQKNDIRIHDLKFCNSDQLMKCKAQIHSLIKKYQPDHLDKFLFKRIKKAKLPEYVVMICDVPGRKQAV